MAILLKLKAYLIAFAGFIVALLGTYLWARHKGTKAGESDQIAADAQATADAIKEQIDTRAEVDLHVNDLPKPKAPLTVTVPAPIPASEGAQQVGSADPSSAAGKLKSGWLRDGES